MIALTGFLLLGLNFYRTEHSQVPIKSIDKDKIQLFYRDDCPDCKKIFKQIYLHNLIKKRDNINQELKEVKKKIGVSF